MEESKEKFDYKTLSIKGQYVWKLCRQIMKDLKNGEGCTDEQIDDLISKTEPRSRGYFREEDFVTADEKALLEALEETLYGKAASGQTPATPAELPLPDKLIEMMSDDEEE